MSAKELIEAASSWKHSIETSRVMTGSFELKSIFHRQLDVCNYILATVRPDDDDPVTRERLDADGLVMLVPDCFYLKTPDGGLAGFHVTMSEQYPGCLWSHGRVIVVRLKSMGHLRRLVAALGE